MQKRNDDWLIEKLSIYYDTRGASNAPVGSVYTHGGTKDIRKLVTNFLKFDVYREAFLVEEKWTLHGDMLHKRTC